MGVSLKMWVCLEVDVAKGLFFALIYICNHVPRPHILKIMKAHAMQMWLLQYIQTEKLKC